MTTRKFKITHMTHVEFLRAVLLQRTCLTFQIRKVDFGLSQRELDHWTVTDPIHTFISDGTSLHKLPHFHRSTSKNWVAFSYTPGFSNPTQVFRISKILIIISLYPEETWSLRYNIENCVGISYSSIDLFQKLNKLVLIG